MPKTVLAVAAGAVAVLLGGCGGHADDAADSEAGTTAASSSVGAAGSPSSTAVAPTSAQQSASAAPTSDAAHPQQGATPNQGPAPEGSPKVENDAEVLGNSGPGATGKLPIEGGVPPSPADEAGIRTLVMGFNDQHTMRSKIGYLPDHTCQRVLAANGGREAFNLDSVPDVPLDSFPGTGQGQSDVLDVTDVLVNGDRASATVTVSGKEGPQSAVQRFEREGGAWTFCD